MKTSSNGGFPLTKASDLERGCFLWSAPEQTAKQNNRDGGDFRCHRAHYDITLMDRDFRRRDAHVAAPYWGPDLVLTTQGKYFPNFKTRPCFKRYVSLQWRCMSGRVRSVSTWLLFKNFLLDLFRSMCNLAFRIIDAIVVDVLLVCRKTLLELPAFSEGNPSVTGFSSQWTRNAELWFVFVISLDKLLNE